MLVGFLNHQPYHCVGRPYSVFFFAKSKVLPGDWGCHIQRVGQGWDDDDDDDDMPAFLDTVSRVTLSRRDRRFALWTNDPKVTTWPPIDYGYISLPLQTLQNVRGKTCRNYNLCFLDAYWYPFWFKGTSASAMPHISTLGMKRNQGVYEKKGPSLLRVFFQCRGFCSYPVKWRFFFSPLKVLLLTNQYNGVSLFPKNPGVS